MSATTLLDTVMDDTLDTTLDTLLWAESLAEPCLAFQPSDGSPVCEACGWLDDEHAAGHRSTRAPIIRRPVRRGAPRLAAAS